MSLSRDPKREFPAIPGAAEDLLIDPTQISLPDMPLEIIQHILREGSDTKNSHSLEVMAKLRVNKSLYAFFKPDFSKKLLEYVVQGNLDKTEALIKLKPFLSSVKCTATDYSRRTIRDVTPFQAALCALDDEMYEMLTKYMGDGEIARQYREIFPEGHEKYFDAQTSFDFSILVNVITQSPVPDVQTALKKQQDDSLLCQALNQFRRDFTALSHQEKVFNPKHLMKAFELYEQQFNHWHWDWQKRNLFWYQVIGFVQRFLPANIAKCFYQRVENNEKSNRNFDFRVGGGSIYPLHFDSPRGLGFDYAGSWQGLPCVQRLWLLMAFTKHMSSKNNKLEKLMPRQQSHASCLIV